MDLSKTGALYTDINSLHDIKVKASNNKDAALKEAAAQFEQIFVDMMLQSMRKANESFVSEDNPFSSSDVRFYQGMYDQQMTTELSANGGIGLAEIIVKQLGGGVSAQNVMGSISDSSSQIEIKDGVDKGLSVKETMLNVATRKVAEASLSRVEEFMGGLYGKDQYNSQPINSSKNEQINDGLPPSSQVDFSEKFAAMGLSGYSGMIEKIDFSSPQKFVESLMPLADKAAKDLGVDPKVLVAQAALETGWGKSFVGGYDGSKNLFNIKKSSSWKGDTIDLTVKEYRGGIPMQELSSFRKYGSYKESFEDYVSFIKNNPRYENALKNSENPVKYVQELQKAGYATDPKYANKIKSIYNGEVMSLIMADRS